MFKALQLASLALACLCLVACGGRAGLSEESGKSFRRTWNAQLDSQPAKKLSSLSATDAKIALERHYGKSKASSGSSGGGFSPGRKGQLTPSTTDIPDGNPSGRKITLQ